MEIMECQLNTKCPCADRGQACLKTRKERKEFNDKITEMQETLEKAKFNLEESED